MRGIPVGRTFVTVRDRQGKHRRFGVFYQLDESLPRNASFVGVGFKGKWTFVHLRDRQTAALLPVIPPQSLPVRSSSYQLKERTERT
jgi:hypothetical protein